MKSIEATALHRFGKLIIILAGGKKALLQEVAKQPPQKYFAYPPCGLCVAPFMKESAFTQQSLLICRVLIKQFMYVVPAGFFVLFLAFLENNGLNGGKTPADLVAVVMQITTISVMFCVYGLIVLYHAVHEKLEGARVFQKFLSMKLLVLLSTMQGAILEGLAASGRIYVPEDRDTRIVIDTMKSMLLAVECPFIARFAAGAFCPHELDEDVEKSPSCERPFLSDEREVGGGKDISPSAAMAKEDMF